MQPPRIKGSSGARLGIRVDRVVVLVLTCALSFVACSAPTPSPSSSGSGPGPSAVGPSGSSSASCGDGKTITANLITEPANLDGNYDTLVIPAQISHNLYDGLFRFDDNLKLQPDLAASYTSPDPSTYDITLRQDVKFQDGTPFTSADVVNSVNRVQNDTQLNSKQRTYVSNVASMDAPSAYEVVFHLKQPDATWISLLAAVFFITPKSVIDKIGDAAFAAHPVGTGPFKFVEWVKGDHVTLEANCNYWMGAPKVSRVIFRFITEPATIVAALKTGQIDLYPQMSIDQAAPLSTDPNIKVTKIVGAQNIWVSMNTLADGPFKDQRVRQAVNDAVDKNAIVQTLLSGYAVASGQPYNERVFGYDPSVAPYPYDPATAKALLAQAGYPNGFSVDLVGFAQIPDQVRQAVAANLEAIGIKVTLKTDPNFFANTFLKSQMGPLTMFMENCTSQLLDADYCTGLHFDSTRRGLYFHTPQTDALIAQARASADPQERVLLYAQLAVDLHDLAPVLYLYSTVDVYAQTKNLVWSPRGDATLWLWAADKS